MRLADVDPRGRCRLDALVRQLQDVARDDSADSDLTNPMNWIVRRTMVEVRTAPVFQEWVELATWCSGYGSRWAERRTQLRGDRGGEIEAVTVWVHIDRHSQRPARLNDDFFEIWGETAADRRVTARTTLPTAWPDTADDEPWPLRFTDIDLLGHVNNAAQWAPVEQALHLAGWTPGPVRAELEHGFGIAPGSDVRLRWSAVDGGVDTWLTADGEVGSVARVRPL